MSAIEPKYKSAAPLWVALSAIPAPFPAISRCDFSHIRHFLALLCVVCFAGFSYGSFTVEPAKITFHPDLRETTAWVELIHTGGGAVAVQLSVLERKLDLDGAVAMGSLPESKDFLVYPAEIILYPGDKQKIQVNYKGKRKITADNAYLLLSRQVELPNLEEDIGVQAGISMDINYYTIIAFETGKPSKLEFISSKSIGDGKIEVIAENRGSGRAIVSEMAIMAGTTKITDFTGRMNSVMPGQRRRFTFKFPRPLTAKEFSVVPDR